MRLLEFEAKEILKKYGIELPAGQAVSAVDGFHFTNLVMLKEQVPIWGRGKASGVIEAGSTEQCPAGIKNLLGKKIRGYNVIKEMGFARRVVGAFEAGEARGLVVTKPSTSGGGPG
jgi:succinyl-CoA synthetase beta subunit